MTEEMLEVRAALNPDTNEPVYGTCTLAVGDGAVKVKFQNGRAVASRSVCETYLVNNGAIEIPALSIFRSRIASGGSAVQSQESVTAEGSSPSLEDMTPEERLATAKRLSDLIQKDQEGAPDSSGDGGEQAAADKQPGSKTTVDEAATEGSEPLADETEKQRSLRLAREHLEEEGEEVPEVEGDAKEPGADESPVDARVVPEGFDDKTAEGDPRCLAKKSDGAQCKNAAKDGGQACQLEAHAKQFAA